MCVEETDKDLGGKGCGSGLGWHCRQQRGAPWWGAPVSLREPQEGPLLGSWGLQDNEGSAAVSLSTGGRAARRVWELQASRVLEAKSGEDFFRETDSAPHCQVQLCVLSARAATITALAAPVQRLPRRGSGQSTWLVRSVLVASPGPPQPPLRCRPLSEPPFPCRLSPLGGCFTWEILKRLPPPNQGEDFHLLICAAFLACLLYAMATPSLPMRMPKLTEMQ